MGLIRSFSLLPVRLLAKQLGAEFLDLDGICGSEQQAQMKTLLHHAKLNRGSLEYIRKSVSGVESVVPAEAENGRAQGRVYDIEYANGHYAFSSPILIPKLFESITGTKMRDFPTSMITDVGAGSGELERFLLEHSMPSSNIFCVDPSQASIERLREWGIKGGVGTLMSTSLPDSSQHMTFLSYFIDYDAAQSETFDAAVRITAPRGRIVFEGLLPARMQVPSGVKTVTRGWLAIQDILRINAAIRNSGVSRNKKIVLERIAYGHRNVYSRYGIRTLPTTFLTFVLCAEM